MRHARFDLAFVSIDDENLPLRTASLVAVHRDGPGGGTIDWEVLAHAIDPAALERRIHRVMISLLDGRVLEGRAILVRSVEGAHVLRGDGPLVGLAESDFESS